MKHFIIALLLSCLTVSAFAQDYERAVGIRLGVTPGFTYKRFFDEERAAMANITFQRGGSQFSLLRQYHQPVLLSISQSLFFYYGYGAHIGYYKWDDKDLYSIGKNEYWKKEVSAAVGFAGNFGLEYHVLKYPISVCLDYKPYYELRIPFDYGQHFYDITMSIYYTF